MIPKKLIFIFVLISANFFAQQNVKTKELANKEFEARNYLKACELYTKSISSEQNNYLLYKNRAWCYYTLEKYHKAISDCNKALGLNPSFSDKYAIIYYRGVSYYKSEKWNEALQDLTVYTDMYENIDAYLAKSNSLFYLQKYQETIKESKHILSIPKINLEQRLFVYRLMAFSYLNIDSVANAKIYTQKIAESDSLSSTGLFLQGLILYEEANYEMAIQKYSKLMILDSAYTNAYFNRGLAYSSRKEYNLALLDFKTYASKTNNDPDAVYQIATTERNLKNHSKALNLFMDYLKTDPNSSDAHNQISWTYFLLHNYKEAMVYAEKSIFLDNKNKDAYDTRGAIYYKLKNYTQAIENFNAVLTLDSLYANSYYYRGLCYLNIKEKEKACTDWLKTLSFNYYEVHDNEKQIGVLINENCSK